MLLLLQLGVSDRILGSIKHDQTYGNGLSQLRGGLKSEAAGLLEDTGGGAGLDGGRLGAQSGGEDTTRDHA